jgi:hypothetical protein
MDKNIIELEQLPIIKYKLEQISTQIKEKVDKATSLVCTEETVKDVKKVRAKLNKEFDELETKRKEVKNEILEKYNEFEEIYKENVSKIYQDADATLKEKISNVENELKKQREEDLKDFFQEHVEANHINGLISFEDVGLNITLSASEKSLKEQIKAFCEKVANDIKAMQSDEDKEEILLEYKNNGFDYAKAKTKIVEKKKILEEFKTKIAQNGDEIKQDEIVIQNVDTMVSAPIEIEEEETYEVAFKVKVTKTQAKELKEYLRERGIDIIA